MKTCVGRVCGLFCGLTLLLAGAASAGQARASAPLPLHFAFSASPVKQNPVEQQTPTTDATFPPTDHSVWVVNNTPCAWDVDDQWERFATDDYLDAGASVTVTDCTIAESNPLWNENHGMWAWWSNEPRTLGIRIDAPSDNLLVSACFQPQGRCFSAAPSWRADLKRYEYHLCIAVSYDPGDPAIQTIPDSNGGLGVYTDRIVTISNPTGKQVRSISGDVAQIGYGPSAAGCAWFDYSMVRLYPFWWTQ